MSFRSAYTKTEFVGVGGFRTPKVPRDEGIYVLSVDDNGKSSWRESAAGSLELGETETTAFRGDLGKEAHDHLSKTNNPHQVTKEQIGLGDVTNEKQIPYSEKGEPSGVATLDINGKVEPNQIYDIDCGSF